MTPLARYFESGISPKSHSLGLEVEHFILNKETGMPMDYELTAQLLEYLAPVYDKVIKEEGRIIALDSENVLITLEPGCQLELSFRNTSDIGKIRSWYIEAMGPIYHFVDEHGYAIAYSGGLPTVPVDDVVRIPKRRYALMERWFEHAGTRGKEMMKGTAAVHVSIDYDSEADFVKKYVVANYLHLQFSFLSANSSYYEGRKNDDILLRDSIWENTDPARTGYMPYTFDKDFGFEAYGKWVESVPLILVHDGEQFIPVGSMSCAEAAEKYGWSDELIGHYLSMVFPFVRVKKFIEIRSADCMPLEYTLAYCALLKGIFYDPENVAYYYEQAKDCSVEQLHEYKRQIEKDGWSARVYGDSSLQHVLHVLLEKAREGLNEKDGQYLDWFDWLVKEKKHIFD